jgi:hypothetical protein
MTQAKTLDYWQNMRIAMEAAGATSSAIYKRASPCHNRSQPVTFSLTIRDTNG